MVPNAPGGRTENLRHTPPVLWRCKPCGKTRIPPGPEFWGYHLRRFMPSARRLLTLGGAAFVGLAATALFAAPASAHTAELVGKSVCDPKTGTFTVTWTLHNKYNLDATLSSAEFAVKKGNATTPGTGKLTVNEISANDTIDVAVQTGVPADSVAKLKIHVVWKDEVKEDVVGKDTPCGKCQPKPTPSESPSPSPSSSGGTGGGEGSPTPSKSNTSPSLPVTGAQTGLYAGGAMVLLGAGAGLFFVARRRRVKFEA